MPTVAELERLAALVGQLTPLTSIQRGELIRAQDWNTVVGALIEVLRAVLATEQEGAVEPHDHPDQVTTGWLDPRLRSLIERGPLADPAGVARLGELERRVQRQIEKSETLIGEQTSLRERLVEVTTRDLSRQANLTQLQRNVEGMVDGRDEVRDLRATLGTIEADVKLAVEASQRFTLNGEPVDMEALDERLRAVEELRQRLTNPDGSLLDAKDLEIRLTELTNTLVTEEELDEALKSVRPGMSEEERAALADSIRSELSAELNTELGSGLENLRGEIQVTLDKSLAEVDQKIADGVSGALPGLQESVLSQARQEIEQAVKVSQADISAEFEKRLTEASDALRAEQMKALDELRGSLPDLIGGEVKNQIAESLKSLEVRLDEVNRHLIVVDGRLADHDKAIAELRTRPSGLTFDESGTVTGLSEEFNKPLDSRVQELTKIFEDTIQAEFAKLNKRLPTLIKKQIDERLGPG